MEVENWLHDAPDADGQMLPRMDVFIQTGLESVQPEADWICHVCQDGSRETLGGPVKANSCGHIFHKHCIIRWLTSFAMNRTTCPECRAEFCLLNSFSVEQEWDRRSSQENLDTYLYGYDTNDVFSWLMQHTLDEFRNDNASRRTHHWDKMYVIGKVIRDYREQHARQLLCPEHRQEGESWLRFIIGDRIRAYIDTELRQIQQEFWDNQRDIELALRGGGPLRADDLETISEQDEGDLAVPMPDGDNIDAPASGVEEVPEVQPIPDPELAEALGEQPLPNSDRTQEDDAVPTPSANLFDRRRQRNQNAGGSQRLGTITLSPLEQDAVSALQSLRSPQGWPEGRNSVVGDDNNVIQIISSTITVNNYGECNSPAFSNFSGPYAESPRGIWQNRYSPYGHPDSRSGSFRSSRHTE